MAQRRVEKILVAQTSFLGDVVLTTPLISEIRRRFPEARLSVLCTPQARGLLAGSPDVHEILTYDKKGAERGWMGLWRKARDLRARAFTIALSPHKSLRTALLLFLSGIPLRIGFRQSAGWFFYHCRVDRDPARHDVERNLSLLQALGIDPQACERRLRVEVTSQAREAVESLFRSLEIGRSGLIFGLNPGSVWPTKRWSAEGFAELIVQLKQRYRCEVLLFGGPEDRDTVAKVQALSGHRGVSLVGKVGLGELACALERCDVFVTNDSGPMHIAVARGIPVVAVFCATTPSLGFYPYSSRAVVVERDLPCRPCSSHGGRRCPLGTEDCIRQITARDVLAGLERLLEEKSQSNRAAADSHQPQWMTL